MISDETKKKLSDAAKRNGFGGKVEIEKLCTKCGITYNGNPIQKICNDCKKNGYIEICSHCGVTFTIQNNKQTKCCGECKKSKPWLRGKRPKSFGENISKSKKKWYKTKEGVEFKKRIGKINSEKMKAYHKTDKGIKQKESNAKLLSMIMKEKISNGEFTPPIVNSFTHWDAVIGNRKFRSSWEACFWYSNQHLLYESVECRTDKQKNGRVYVGDFFDKELNILYEIKPKSFYLKQSYKIDSLIRHCNMNNYKFIWINEHNILNYINTSDFKTEEEILQLNKLYDGIKKG